MLCQLKSIYQINKGHDEVSIPAVEEVSHVSIYPHLESMGFDTDIFDGVVKIRAAIILREIVCLHQYTKNILKYVHTNSKYGHLFAIPPSETQDFFSRDAKDKVWVDEILLRLSGGKEENKVAMAQYLSKYLFDKYEDEEIITAYKCGLPVSTSMWP